MIRSISLCDMERSRRSMKHSFLRQIPLKKDLAYAKSFFLAMGYEKDIFGSFAYDFELSQKLIFG